jgi:hypothetical protein
VAEGAAFVNGAGVGKPEGFLSANANLSSTNSGAATTIADANGQADGILGLKYAIKSAYARNATWAPEPHHARLGAQAEGRQQAVHLDAGPAERRAQHHRRRPLRRGARHAERGRRATTRSPTATSAAPTPGRPHPMEMLRDPYTQATSGNIRFIVPPRVGGQVVLAEALAWLKCST